ncbi:RNA exonuclease 1 [Cavenderia fasciculata]|uniref:RNA exonuclease 1 n=1 Tax=Cavenderia fasciculata TaxID=261658 RepID=F4Q8S3_CACFS|nr:RNA exonuclease 1 [Cavenderia fasciculata]EGG15092.1 RNA exonuclease 1 [Cavenderia fasciculata]|eukprot:XP_004351812.1 RNA exonuclease 1 [Cavenderia fasciculata]
MIEIDNNGEQQIKQDELTNVVKENNKGKDQEDAADDTQQQQSDNSSNMEENQSSTTPNHNKKKKRKKVQQQSTATIKPTSINNHSSSGGHMNNRFGSLDDDDLIDDEMTLSDKLKKKKKRKGTTTTTTTTTTATTSNSSGSVSQSQILNLVNNNSNDVFEEIYGKHAKVEIELLKQKRNSGCSVRDLQHYLLWLLSDFQLPLPAWVFTKNKPLLQKVVLITLPGLNYMMFEKATLLTGKPWFQSFLTQRMLFNVPSNSIMTPPGSSIYANLLQIKSTTKSNHKNAAQKGPIVHVSAYVLTDEELIENGYPMPNLYFDKEGWSTPNRDGSGHELLSIDCEMCRTNEGLELARISIVNESKTVLMDEYVKPDNEIIDYLTVYSGITSETLKNVKTKLADIQTKMLALVSKSTILMGHSLENDFKALRFAHGRVIDTAVLYPTGSTNKFPLRYLTKKYLNRVIQNNGGGGHNSTEDAIAVMDLVKLKVARGKSFGTKAEKFENLFDKLVQYKKKATLVDTMDEIAAHATPSVSAFKCANDEEMVERMIKQVKGPSDFICSRIYQLSHYYKSIDQHKPTTNNKNHTTKEEKEEEEEEKEKETLTSTTTTTTSTTLSVSSDDSPQEQNGADETQQQPIKNITPIVVDESIVKELDSWGGMPVDQKLYDLLDSVNEKIKKIWDNMTPNSMMILACGPGPYNDINRFRGVAGKESEYVLSLSGSKEGFLFLGVK